MTIGERIRAVRKQAGLSLGEFAKAIGCNKSAVSFWESGRNFPSCIWIAEIARRFGVSCDWILLGTERRKTQ